MSETLRFKPVKNYLVLEPIKEETTLALPDNVEEDYSKVHAFKVIDAGPEVDECKVGDVVIFEGEHTVFSLQAAGEKLVVARSDAVVFIAQGEENGTQDA